MHEFTDSANPPRVWRLTLTIGDLQRVKENLPIDLMDILQGEPPLVQRLQTDPYLLCQLLYVVCQPAADAAGISPEEFAGSLGGQAAAAGFKALWEEIQDFFRGLERTDLVEVMRQAEIMVEATKTATKKQIETLDVAALIDRTCGKLFTDAQASLDKRLSGLHYDN